jgi:hypothetical protein
MMPKATDGRDNAAAGEGEPGGQAAPLMGGPAEDQKEPLP